MSDDLARLRAPFPPEAIGKLPRVTCGDCSDRRKTCTRHSKARCGECGGYVSTAHIHLDYVGHAAVTHRLLEVDPRWSWEPMALDDRGLPLVTEVGGESTMWIRLTVCGMTRLGVGTCPAGSFERDKQLISDCLIEGTPVRTADGWKPIESVEIGDHVVTRRGWRPVTDRWLSDESAPVVAVLLDDGRLIVGTPHHRVPTQRGPAYMGALRNGDMLYAWPDTGNRNTPRKSVGTGALTAECPPTGTGLDGPTTWPRRSPKRTSTETSTSTTTDQSRRVGTSTISTTILQTTIQATSVSFRRQSTPVITTQNVNHRVTPVTVAASTSNLPSALATFDGARLGARKPPGVPLVSSSPARVAPSHHEISRATSAAHSSHPSSRGRGSARPRVVAVLDAGVAPVWNLSVDEVHEYLANGVFVHNSLRNAAMRFGVALDLWSKEDLHHAEQDPPAPEPDALESARASALARVQALTGSQRSDLADQVPKRKVAEWDRPYLDTLAAALDTIESSSSLDGVPSSGASIDDGAGAEPAALAGGGDNPGGPETDLPGEDEADRLAAHMKVAVLVAYATDRRLSTIANASKADRLRRLAEQTGMSVVDVAADILGCTPDEAAGLAAGT